MHNLDRVMLELNEEELEAYEEAEDHGELAPCTRCGGAHAQATAPTSAGTSALSEDEVFELAAELLEVQDEEEIDQFLGKLFQRIGTGLKRFAQSRVGQAIGGFLKGAARTVLPVAGRVLGGVFGGPVGATIGGRIGDAISGAEMESEVLARGAEAFGLELGELGEDDMRFEIAQRFVRFSEDAIQRAMELSEEVGATAAPMQTARNAFRDAAATHAPGLVASPRAMQPPARLSPVAPAPAREPPRSGRWVRQGSRIILLGL